MKKNDIWIWCKIVLKIGIEQIEENEVSKTWKITRTKAKGKV
jgi:hypothetical protein